MTEQASFRRAEGESLAAWRASLNDRVGALKTHVLARVVTCADYHRAAALYDQLSGVSDAELTRRGLIRRTLAWDVSQACDRSNG